MWRGRGGHCRIDRGLFVVDFQAGVVRGLIDVNTFEYRVPHRNQQPSTTFPERSAAAHSFQRAAQRLLRGVLPKKRVHNAADLLPHRFPITPSC